MVVEDCVRAILLHFMIKSRFISLCFLSQLFISSPLIKGSPYSAIKVFRYSEKAGIFLFFCNCQLICMKYFYYFLISYEMILSCLLEKKQRVVS